MSAAAQLTTRRLCLRQPRATDLGAYTRYCASDRSRFVRGPFTATEAFDTFAAIIGHWTLRGFGRYVIAQNGAPIGHVGPPAMDERHPPEFTWTLWTADAEGHGFATEACRAVLTHLFADLGWSSVASYIDAENHASRALALRLGAKSDPAAAVPLPGCVAFRHCAEGLRT